MLSLFCMLYGVLYYELLFLLKKAQDWNHRYMPFNGVGIHFCAIFVMYSIVKHANPKLNFKKCFLNRIWCIDKCYQWPTKDEKGKREVLLFLPFLFNLSFLFFFFLIWHVYIYIFRENMYALKKKKKKKLCQKQRQLGNCFKRQSLHCLIY